MKVEPDQMPTTDEMRVQVMEALRNVYDPELGINIVDLGLVYAVAINADGYVTVTMTLTIPGCPMHESIGDGVGAALWSVPGVSGGEINIVWEPRWDPAMMSEEARAALTGWTSLTGW